jgi:nucleotide-binding universal stress UspA family protein
MKRFKNILVLCDDDSIADSAFDRVAWLAEANGAGVTLVDVVEAGPTELARRYAVLGRSRGADLAERLFAARRARLQTLAERLGQRGAQAKIAVDTGTTFIEVIRRVLRDGHDLVIKSERGSASAPLLLSDDMHLLRKCPCPVWVLNTRLAARSRRILAAVDPDPDDPVRDRLNHTIMQLATSLAEQDDAWLDVVNVWSLPEESTLRHSGFARVSKAEVDVLVDREEARSAARFRRLTDDFADHIDRMRLLHIKGRASEILPEHAENETIDTLVMGTVARTGIAGLFIGNTAETVLAQVKCSILTVKPEGFVSPVSAQ